MAGVIDQLTALRRFVTALDGQLPPAHRDVAMAVIGKADQRLSLSGDHTVVALAGATGSGKSSIFNAIAGSSLSSVSVRRPTTSVTHACYWNAEGVDSLLDWLAIAPNRRFDQQCPLVAESETRQLRGLVLLDLPDFDSMDVAHHAEVRRILDLVDHVVWILDPQKYADKTLHEAYLRPLANCRGMTAVVLNQVDTLSATDTGRCLADLRELLLDDGLVDVPVIATSTVASDGLAPLRSHLAQVIASGDAALVRLASELAGARGYLAPLVALDVREDRLDRAAASPVIDALAMAVGVPAIVDAIEPAYLGRAAASTGWPIARWFRGVRPDPRRRLPAGAVLAGAQMAGARVTGCGPSGETVSAHHLVPEAPFVLPPAGFGRAETAVPWRNTPEASAGQRAAAALAARELASTATAGLPAPWPDAAVAAALANEQDIPGALDAAIAKVVVTFGTPPRWWHGVRALHLVAAGAAAFGLLWLFVLCVCTVTGLPGPSGPFAVPAGIFCCSLLAGLLMSLVARPLVSVSARRARARAELRLRVAVAEVASDLIVSPVRQVMRTYADARAALHAD